MWKLLGQQPKRIIKTNSNYVLFCTIICIIFTPLCKNLVKLTGIPTYLSFSRSFSMPSAPWHRKASAKTQVSLTRFLQSEVKLIHIIVQDQDGQNNNIIHCLLLSTKPWSDCVWNQLVMPKYICEYYDAKILYSLSIGVQITNIISLSLFLGECFCSILFVGKHSFILFLH